MKIFDKFLDKFYNNNREPTINIGKVNKIFLFSIKLEIEQTRKYFKFLIVNPSNWCQLLQQLFLSFLRFFLGNTRFQN